MTIASASVRLVADDGHIFSAWQARPEQPVRGGLVVLQEIFGVTPHIRAVVDRFAAAGWACIAPALFDRVAPDQVFADDAPGIAQARAVRARVTDEEALLDAAAAMSWLQEQHPLSRIGVVGYCWGGTLTWLAAARLPQLSAAVAYYGTAIAAHLNEAPRVPMLLHFGERDAHIPVPDVDRIAAACPRAELHRYPAGHGFDRDTRRAVDGQSADEALERTDQFLDKHLARR